MTNIRLKKTDSNNRQKEKPEEVKNVPKNETFPDGSSDDDLGKKRKMILTGITAGVGVAGAAAAGLLFFGPFSPFGMKENEKQDNIPTEKPVESPAKKEEPFKVQVPQEHMVEQSNVIAAPVGKESAKTSSNKVAVAPPVKETETNKQNLIEAPKKINERPTVHLDNKDIPPPFIAPKNDISVAALPKEATGPAVYNYDILDGGPLLNIPQKQKIYVSRDPNFKKIYLNGSADSSGKYRISIPPPGEIYWKDQNDNVHKMTIIPPESSALIADIPEQLKLKDTIKWNSNGKVSFYRIEIATDIEFLNRVKVFSTVKTSFPVQNIGKGRWYLKISALNLQSGTWDFTKIFPINIEDHLIIKEPVVIEQPKKEEQPAPMPEVKEAKPEEPTPTVQPEDPPVKAAEPVAPVEATVPEKSTIQPPEE
ncbi:hypothetical protein QEJ31_13090 [Pigmentibacter sp. JX0631]|uniref:hypothetical protein n=1 Tax=Pigmentibacter sp. JX0631 TaxID=2976982 RepID=UPI002469754F|nr:hypothetical protein [Pigmentibacter sp. JX0631]WGL59459.1 hypothetical protein QEJ31_13090 [Pigmentibacter sp. JX0631]